MARPQCEHWIWKQGWLLMLAVLIAVSAWRGAERRRRLSRRMDERRSIPCLSRWTVGCAVQPSAR